MKSAFALYACIGILVPTFPSVFMQGLHGLGRLEQVASALRMPEEEIPRVARGRRGLAREVNGESEPYEDPVVRRWIQDEELREMMEQV